MKVLSAAPGFPHAHGHQGHHEGRETSGGRSPPARGPEETRGSVGERSGGSSAWTIGKWTCLGTGAVCLGLFNAFWYMGDRTYDEYLESTEPSAAETR